MRRASLAGTVPKSKTQINSRLLQLVPTSQLLETLTTRGVRGLLGGPREATESQGRAPLLRASERHRRAESAAQDLHFTWGIRRGVQRVPREGAGRGGLGNLSDPRSSRGSFPGKQVFQVAEKSEGFAGPAPRMRFPELPRALVRRGSTAAPGPTSLGNQEFPGN